ncbi:MAG: metallophosphoesterase, partial [Planctomycetota bacterium]
MAPVVILHLTDLHFGWEPASGDGPSAKDRRRNCLNSLVRHLGDHVRSEPEWRPKIVAVTGDIGWRGNQKDYEQAREWFDDLLKAIGLGYQNVLVCAGNHDIDRDEEEGVGVPSVSEEADRLLRIPIHKNRLRAFAAFSEFCQEAGVAAYSLDGTSSFLVGMTELEGIAFAALNSAWCCRGEDQGKLWIGRPHLDRLIAQQQLLFAHESSRPVVALIHHPPGWWHTAETNAWDGRPNTQDVLAKRCHLLLTGHNHGEVREPDRIAQGAYHLTGGAAYSGSQHHNSVRLIRICHDRFSCRSLKFDPHSATFEWQTGAVSRELPFFDREQPPTPPPLPPHPPAIAHYIHRLAEDTRGIQLLGMGRSFQVDLPIDDVYVPLRLVRFTRQRSEDEPERLPQGNGLATSKDDESAESEMSVEQDLAEKGPEWMFQQCQQQKKRGVVVLGEPGAGKTTWARQLAWRLASGTARPEALGLPTGLRPVLLKLRNLTVDNLSAGLDPLLSLKNFLQRETSSYGAPTGQRDPSDEFWDDPQRGMLWILDGL